MGCPRANTDGRRPKELSLSGPDLVWLVANIKREEKRAC